jgi:hypothetical protein
MNMQDPFVGTWKLNVEKSEFDPNHRPAAGIMTVEVDAEGCYLQKAEGLNAKGEKVVERPMRLIPDGNPHPVPDFPGLTYFATKPEPNTMTTEARREDGSVVGGGTTVVAPDGLSKRVTNFGVDTQLRQFRQTTVWDRQ